MCEIAVKALFEDTKHLVSKGIRADIQFHVDGARSPQDRQAAIDRGVIREYHLKIWLNTPLPLVYGDDRNPVFQTLVQALAPTEEQVALGLPHMSDNSMSPKDFINSLIEMSRPSDPDTPRAPVLSNGAFLPLLKLAHKHVIDLSQEDDPDAQHSFLYHALFLCFKMFPVRFVPYNKPPTGRAGAPSRTPVFNHWASLGSRASSKVPSLKALSSQRHPSSSQRAADDALANALNKDCNAEWAFNPLNITDMQSIVHRTNLPMDYTFPTPSDANYVNETYAWVKNNYDGTNRLHHLALIIAMIASFLLPKLFTPSQQSRQIRARFLKADTEDKVQDIYNDIPWVARNKSGLSDRRIFVCMFTTFIIALYEPESPLRLKMAQCPRSGLGDPWTDKHSTFHLLSFFLIDSSSLS